MLFCICTFANYVLKLKKKKMHKSKNYWIDDEGRKEKMVEDIKERSHNLQFLFSKLFVNFKLTFSTTLSLGGNPSFYLFVK